MLISMQNNFSLSCEPMKVFCFVLIIVLISQVSVTADQFDEGTFGNTPPDPEDPVRKTVLVFNSSGVFDYNFSIGASIGSFFNTYTRLYLSPKRLSGMLNISFIIIPNENQRLSYPQLPTPFIYPWLNLDSIVGRTIRWGEVYNNSKSPSVAPDDNPNIFKIQFLVSGIGATNVTVENEPGVFTSQQPPPNRFFPTQENPYNLSSSQLDNMLIFFLVLFLMVLFYVLSRPRFHRPREWKKYRIK